MSAGKIQPYLPADYRGDGGAKPLTGWLWRKRKGGGIVWPVAQ